MSGVYDYSDTIPGDEIVNIISFDGDVFKIPKCLLMAHSPVLRDLVMAKLVEAKPILLGKTFLHPVRSLRRHDPEAVHRRVRFRGGIIRHCQSMQRVRHAQHRSRYVQRVHVSQFLAS